MTRLARRHSRCGFRPFAQASRICCSAQITRSSALRNAQFEFRAPSNFRKWRIEILPAAEMTPVAPATPGARCRGDVLRQDPAPGGHAIWPILIFVPGDILVSRFNSGRAPIRCLAGRNHPTGGRNTISGPKTGSCYAEMLDSGSTFDALLLSSDRAAPCCILPNGRVDTSVIFACRCKTATHQSGRITGRYPPDALAALNRDAAFEAGDDATAPGSWPLVARAACPHPGEPARWRAGPRCRSASGTTRHPPIRRHEQSRRIGLESFCTGAESHPCPGPVPCPARQPGGLRRRIHR